MSFFSRSHIYQVNPMDSMTEERKVERGCWAWCSKKADAFRNAVARTCCGCCSAIPSVVLILIAICILIFLLSVVPMAVYITYNAPLRNEMSNYEKLNVWRLNDGSTAFFNGLGRQPLLSTALLKPPNVTSCVENGFSCTKTPSIIISKNQRCDGHPDCPDDDGSDEEDCENCLTSFSCPTKDGSHRLHCLRGDALCDGSAQCADESDELLYCHANCEINQYKCKSADRCIPHEFRCDGDIHCPGGDDEDQCEATDCRGGSKFCNISNKCIPIWHICDGINHCENGQDEVDCNCETCSSSDSALCTQSNMCIEKSQVCDGSINCLNGEDEFNCVGQCDILADVRANDVVCNDGKVYAWEYACSGLYPQCDGRCETCNLQLAIKCGEKCLHRSRVCNGQSDCPSAVDEQNCPDECDDPSRICDGFKDCPTGVDEQNCLQCNKSAIHCRADNKCIPSHMRCDGHDDCSDGQDELKCDCKDCAIHPHQMYFCEQATRCFRMDEVCKPQTRCPNPSPKDKMFCATRNGTLHYF